MKGIYLSILFLLLLPIPVIAADKRIDGDDWDTPAKEEIVPPLKVEGFSPDNLSGKWAFGMTYSSSSGLYEILVRHWLDNGLGVDFMLGGNYQPPPSPLPVGISVDQWNYELGLGFRQNIARPVDNVLVQLIFELNYVQSFIQQTDTSVNPNSIFTTQAQTLNVFVGPGFEAFLPFWKNLSVEASLGVNFSSNWNEHAIINNGFQPLPNSSYTNSWNWSLGAGNNNTTFSILNAAVHFYL